MPAPVTDAGEKLRKLGEWLRKGFAIAHPVSAKSLATIKDAVREQWEREQIEKQKPPVRTPEPKTRAKETSKPGPER